MVLVHFKRQFIYEYLTSLQEHHYYEVGKNVNRIDNLPIGNSDIILFGVSSTFSIESMQSNCSLNSIDLYIQGRVNSKSDSIKLLANFNESFLFVC